MSWWEDASDGDEMRWDELTMRDEMRWDEREGLSEKSKKQKDINSKLEYWEKGDELICLGKFCFGIVLTSDENGQRIFNLNRRATEPLSHWRISFLSPSFPFFIHFKFPSTFLLLSSFSYFSSFSFFSVFYIGTTSTTLPNIDTIADTYGHEWTTRSKNSNKECLMLERERREKRRGTETGRGTLVFI